MNNTFIDKLAFLEINKRKLLVSLSRGKDTWYIPGGKREGNETDIEALTREVTEELTVTLIPESIKKYGVFEAQAHGKPPGTIVRMTCYTALYKGTMKSNAEIDAIDYFEHKQKLQCSPVDHLIFDDLKMKGLID